MDDLTRMWIGAIPSLDPDSREVILDLDHTSTDPGERMACRLLNRGHEGEEGVFYLLPEDLSARYERSGDRLAVTVLAHRELLARDLTPDRTSGSTSGSTSGPTSGPTPGADDLAGHLDSLPSDPRDDRWVVLLRRETVTDFEPVRRDGEYQPVLLLDHAGGHPAGPVTPAELIAGFEAGESGIAVINART
ncbi:hypothetical protein ACFXAZ_24475 [Streptomyces sp. NPDC059477]|uniref:hypothetical protein n=1 Tax=Streptomyces sp. NPDC059477 TaxID=3346847 RepID=UPI003678CADF